jgi:hypothetical protein
VASVSLQTKGLFALFTSFFSYLLDKRKWEKLFKKVDAGVT